MKIRDVSVYHAPNVLWHYRVPTYDELGARCKSLEVGYIHQEDDLSESPSGVWNKGKAGGGQIFDWMVVFNFATIKAVFSGCDCLLLEWNLRNVFLIPTTLIARFVFRKKVVWWGHGESKNEGFLTRLTLWAGRGIPDRVVVYMDETRDRLVSCSGYDRDKAFVARNGVDVKAIKEMVGVFGDRRDSSVWVTAYSGRLNKGRDLDRIVRAVSDLNDRGIACRHIFIGDGEEREKLFQLAVDLGVENKISFVGAVHDVKSLAKIYSEVDFVVVPGWLGLVLNQAYAFGKPVLICDEGSLHNPEIRIFNEEAGWSYSYDGDCLSETLAKIFILGKAGVKQMGAVGQSIIEEGYSTQIMVDGLQKSIEGV